MTIQMKARNKPSYSCGECDDLLVNVEVSDMQRIKKRREEKQQHKYTGAKEETPCTEWTKADIQSLSLCGKSRGNRKKWTVTGLFPFLEKKHEKEALSTCWSDKISPGYCRAGKVRLLWLLLLH